MKILIYDIFAMALVSLLLACYLDLLIEPIIVFVVGLVSLQQLRKMVSKRIDKSSISSKTKFENT